MNKLAWSAGAAVLAGFVLWLMGLTKPLWRAAAVIIVAAVAAGYVAPCCEACEKGQKCPACVRPG